MRIVFVSVVLALTTAAAFVGSPSARASGAERLPALCIANIYNGIATLNVGVLTPEYPPYWDVTAPVGAWVYASGYATFTPSGNVNVTRTQSPRVISIDEQWPSGTFTGSAVCRTARGGESDARGTGAKLYEGRATVVTVADGHVTITCHMEYTHTVAPL